MNHRDVNLLTFLTILFLFIYSCFIVSGAAFSLSLYCFIWRLSVLLLAVFSLYVPSAVRHFYFYFLFLGLSTGPPRMPRTPCMCSICIDSCTQVSASALHGSHLEAFPTWKTSHTYSSFWQQDNIGVAWKQLFSHRHHVDQLLITIIYWN